MSPKQWYDGGYKPVEDEIERIESGRDFLPEMPGKAMRDKDKVRLVFVPAKIFGLEKLPLSFRQHWMMTPEGKRPFTCVRMDEGCVPCLRGNTARFRVVWPVVLERIRKVEKEVVKEWVAAVWMRGSQCAGKIQALEDEKCLYGRVVVTTRQGEGLDTEYQYVPTQEIDTAKKFKEQVEKLANFWDRYAPKEPEAIEAVLKGVEEVPEEAEKEKNPFEETSQPEY